MKIHKKILSLFMALSILFSSAVPVFAADNGFYPSRSGGGEFNTFRKYYTKDDGYGRFNQGDTVYTSILEKDNITDTYTYNYISNNTYTSYSVSNITYNNETNNYEFTVNETNYYINYSPTYVTVMYYDTDTQQNIKNDYYYQLPDGRNSYDLTADDVWGTYFIYNAVNYNDVLEDDGYTKCLYHFDGNLKNSAAVNSDISPSVSVINYQNGRFDGALIQNVVNYTPREFIFPSISATTVDFWVFFSSLCYNSSNQSFYYSNVYPSFLANTDNSSSTKYYSIPTDTWVHIAIQYDSSITARSKWQLYINGVFSGTVNWYALNNIVFVSSSGGSFYRSSSFGIDELRITAGKKLFDTSGFTPMSQPYDTNLVLVLPESGTENDIAVKSNIPVSDLRVGGVRPTYPTNGYVYVYLEGDIVKDVQQYQIDGWYSVDACIYEDDNWVSLADKDLSSYMISEDDFSSTDDTTGGDSSDSTTGGDTSTDEDETTGLLSSIMEKITGFFTGLLDVLFGGILDLITVITDNLTSIIDGFSEIIGFIGALFGFLPDEMISVLTSGLAIIIICVIIKIFI